MFDEDGVPRQSRGIVAEQPGLYFVGQDFQYCKASETVPGVSRDARYVAEHIASSITGADSAPERRTAGRRAWA